MTRQFFGGYKPDKPDSRDYIFTLTKKRGVNLTDIDLRKTGLLPDVYDQGNTSSCVGNATAAAVAYTRAKEQLSNFMPSRMFIYYNARAIENDTDADDGCEIRDAMDGVLKSGVCPETLWEFTTADLLSKPSQAAYDFAIKDVIKSYQRIVDLNGMQAALSRGFPVVVGIEVFDNFMSTGSDGIVSMPSGNLLGGHALLVVGIKGDDFIVRNSWSAQWGDGGYCYIPQAYIMNPNLSGDYWQITVA